MFGISTIFKLGKKSYIGGGTIEGDGIISVGNISSLSWNLKFNLGLNMSHNYRNVTSTSSLNTDWEFPREFLPPRGMCKIIIGSDVWIGRGCILSSTNPNKPLIIGDGAVIASDSVVVKNVPPYAIVGGNPAQVIKYRFEPHIIEALLQIKWWDWSLDKIHDNFNYFNDIEKFISLNEKNFTPIHEEVKQVQMFYKSKSYFTARIDVKLMSIEGDFQILYISDEKASVLQPAWFQKEGVGYVIESYTGHIDFIARSTVDGQLLFYLRGIDIHGEEDKTKRIPYWIDYTKLVVNGQTIFDTLTPAWHNKPYRYAINARADEEIKIQIEWQPHKGDI